MTDNKNPSWGAIVRANEVQKEIELRTAITACVARARHQRGVPLTLEEVRAIEKDNLLESGRVSHGHKNDYSMELELFKERER